MNSHKIAYCDSNGFLLKNDRTKYDIISKLKAILGYDFLNPINKSYSDRLLPIIKKQKLLATYITTGKYVYMYLTKIYNENICLIIELETNTNNKYPKIISVPCNFRNEFFEKDTLFYGELYRTDKKKWFFLIESIKLHKGAVFKGTIYDNIKLINTVLKTKYKYVPISPFLVKTKKYFTTDAISENIDSLSVNLKGLKLVGLVNSICFYFKNNFYSNKYVLVDLPKLNNDLKPHILKLNDEYSTSNELNLDIIDELLDYTEKEYILELRKSKIYGIYNLYARNNKLLEKIGIARTDTIELSVLLLNTLANVNSIIVKVLLDKNFRKFKVLHVTNSSNISDFRIIQKELELINKFPNPQYISGY